MKNPGGKSRYSVDEMMERLKDAQAAKEGRSRRRRSYQPARRRRRWLLGIVVAALLLLVLGIAGALGWAFFSHVRYEGDAFRRAFSERLSELVGMDVEFASFDAQGRRLSTKQAGFRSRDQTGVIKEVRASGIAASMRWGSFFSPNWTANPLEIHEMAVLIGLPADGASGVDAPGDRLGLGGFGLSSRPDEISLGTVRVRELSIGWSDNADPGTLSLSHLERAPVSAEVFGDSTRFQGAGGTLHWGLLGPFRIGSLVGESRGRIINLERLRLSKSPQDEVIIEGRIDLRAGGAVDLKGTMTRLSLKEILPEYWFNRISGNVDATFAVNRTLSPGEPLGFAGEFSIQGLIMRNLPLLESLSVLATEPAFSLIEVPALSGTFRREGELLVLEDFTALRSGLTRLDGRITLARDGTLGGNVRIGIPSAAFEQLVGGRPDFFEPDDDGFAYATMALSGTLAEPMEDLTERLQQRVRETSVLLNERRTAPAPQSPPAPAITPDDQSSPPAPDPQQPPQNTGAAEEKLEDAFESLIR